MNSYTLNISGRKEGSLFQNKTIVPVNGPYLTITNEPVPHKDKGCFGLVQVAVDKSNYRIAGGDRNGNIYLFDSRKNRFWRICNLNHCCSFLVFTSSGKCDLIAAVSDCSISLLNSERSLVLKTAHTHKSCINHISVDETGTRILTSSIEEAFIWNLADLTLLHKLADWKNVNVLKVFFLPVKNDIVCAFKSSFLYFWDSNTFKFKTKFACYDDGSWWLKTVDASKDGQIIACGGKTGLIFIWGVETNSFLHKLSFNEFLTSVSQVVLSSHCSLKQKVMLFIDQSGKLHFYNVSAENYVSCIMVDEDDKIVFLAECGGKLALITSSGALKLYELKKFFQESTKPKTVPPVITLPNLKVKVVQKKSKAKPSEFSSKSLKEILFKLKEYPAAHRNFIWSQLLNLPKNEQYQNFYEENHYHSYTLVGKKYDDVTGTVKRALARQLSMLTTWCSFLKEINYIPDLVFPFVKLLHRNMQMCFEVLVTLISNWCRNWFFYVPFPPYNILYVVESLLVYHDRLLLHHFMQHDISPDIYAFRLLQSSFSQVFDGDQWLKFWDHVFSNPPSFLIFLVSAFNIVAHKVLLQCESESDFNVFYSQKCVSVSSVIDKAYQLMEITPICFDPGPVVGSFCALPKGGYPPFTRITYANADFQTLKRRKILEEELDHFSSATRTANRSNLKELKDLLDIRRSLLLESLEMKNVDRLKEVEEKVKKLQQFIQENLIRQEESFSLQKLIEEPAVPETSSSSTDSLSTINDVLQLREQLINKDMETA